LTNTESLIQVLSDDDEKRSLYDQFGELGLQGDFDGSAGGSEGVDPFDVFDTFFWRFK
jgi:molecular chaperone DnaJ